MLSKHHNAVNWSILDYELIIKQGSENRACFVFENEIMSIFNWAQTIGVHRSWSGKRVLECILLSTARDLGLEPALDMISVVMPNILSVGSLQVISNEMLKWVKALRWIALAWY